MQAQDDPFTQLLEGSKQFVIPIFQRTYSWEQPQCQQLWDDIVRVGQDASLNSHFIGSVVYIPEANVDAAMPRWLVIDGQQRITTVTLLLLAFKQQLESDSLHDPISPEQLEDQYLKNRYGKGDDAYRLLLTRSDKEVLIQLLDGKAPSAEGAYRVIENYRFFCESMAKADLDTVWKGIKKLMIVNVRLQQGIDNPQMIFESMNSTGKALTQADLIRNYVLMGLSHDLQTRLYTDYWHPMEAAFGADHYSKAFDEFMRFFLVIHTGDTRIRRDQVYDAFKAYSRQQDVEPLLEQVKQYADFYCRIALNAEQDKHLAEVFHDIRELRVDVAYPMLMEVYRDYQEGKITHSDFLDVARLVESYVFRRAVCDIPTNSQRQTFASFMRQVDKSRYVESFKARFLLLPSYRRFPHDEEFTRQIQQRNLYKFNRRSYWLRRMENHDRKERVAVNDYTIEHIMPQNENLNSSWRDDLGEDWQRVQEQYLHTLGNLTLTGYNSKYSDRSFTEKRDIPDGFRDSPLRLNKGLGTVEAWNEAAINTRAARLAEFAAQIWTAPALSEQVLDSYRVAPKTTGNRSVEDFTPLVGGPVRELFDSFREQILQLDQCVSEECLKLYIAYKAETNFVDVIPQAKGLLLVLNMRFPDIDDPRDLCRDISNLGRWGNGDVEVRIDKAEDLPYVLGLVRQSLEQQLGDEGD